MFHMNHQLMLHAHHAHQIASHVLRQLFAANVMMATIWIQITSAKHAMSNVQHALISILAIHAIKAIILQVKIHTFALNAQLQDASYAIEMAFVMIA